MALTGGLAAAGKSALLAMQIWRDDVNAKGGLMGRPVKLVYYDDQSNPATVPGIYTKLLDVDKVDLIVSGYGTNMIAPAMPVAIEHDRLFLGLFGAGGEQRVPLSRNTSRCCRPGPIPNTPSRSRSSRSRWRRTPSRRHSPSSPQTPNIRRTPPKAPRPRQVLRAQDRLRQELPARDARFLADRPRHPGDQPEWCLSPPTRRARPAWCAPPRKSASRPGISAAAWSACNSRR